MRSVNINFATSLVAAIALCACWLIISTGCGQRPAVTRPTKPLPKTQEVQSTIAPVDVEDARR